MVIINDILTKFNNYFELLKQTQQHHVWHGEGDVFTHTMMVVDEVNKLSISENDKDILILTALLHDIGKPQTFSIEDGVIRSHGHTKTGYHIALEILDELNTPFDIKIQIINLILYHSKPLHILEANDPDKYVIKLSMDVRLDLLSLFSECDIKGRIANDINESLFKIECFKEHAQKLNCYEQPFKFNSNFTKFSYLVKENCHFLSEIYDNTKSKVYIMSGLMGAGKDYYIKNNFKNISIISLDDIRKEMKIKPTDNQGLVIQTAIEKAKEYLRKGENFVLNSTNISKDMRDKIIGKYIVYDPYIEIIYIDKNIKTILKQNKEREEEKRVPEDVIIKSYRKLEIPKQYEAHNVRYVTV